MSSRRQMCSFAVFFSVSRPFFSLHGHFRLCYKEKLEQSDRACYGKQVTGPDFRCFICMSLRRVSYNLPCVSTLFWPVSIARYVCKSPGIYLLFRDKIWRLLWMCCLHSKLWRRARLWLELLTSTVGRFLSRVSYLSSYIFLRESYSF